MQEAAAFYQLKLISTAFYKAAQFVTAFATKTIVLKKIETSLFTLFLEAYFPRFNYTFFFLR